MALLLAGPLGFFPVFAASLASMQNQAAGGRLRVPKLFHWRDKETKVKMFLNEEERRSPSVVTPFKTTAKGFTYLGINITPSLNEISTVNYYPLVEKVTEMLNRWSNLPISMIGRIHFQTLPLSD